MWFQHSPGIRREFPELAAGALVANGITSSADVKIDHLLAEARLRLRDHSPAELDEIQAWRRTFAAMGLKPTQYRSAAESLLRRFAKEGELPRIHPLIDLCNAASLAWAVPIAVIDVGRVAAWLEVRHADGTERYETFGGETEHPAVGEVIFADADGYAHARRWCHRQSGRSAVREGTTDVLIVAEALHESAAADVASLLTTLSDAVETAWSPPAQAALLTATEPRIEF
ncbi:B3/B4 domain-containing protein [Phytoactinopolyspora halotolerans]|uniref:B3/B4 tRNA-binding domain-containing protein n=1 Tax=Phytoactinopolyspora halotolerans TaxID=1981512 RepID=A0A6L9SHC7_9ACTN|nr:phenylalanine--tRNA ligase beta subunit-related protein [Phytoactinopolyspora halotolerans]NEE04533.1 hypothetical protein [Phytoactinopolyspora halotolerans]